MFAHLGESHTGLSGEIDCSVIAAILQLSVQAASLSCLEAGEAFTLTEFRIDLIRAVDPGAGPLRCRAVVGDYEGELLRASANAVAVRADVAVGHASSSAVIG